MQILTISLKIKTNENIEHFYSSIWFWIAIIELILIISLLKKQKQKTKGDVNESTDMDNLMNSIYGSRDLYKELAKKCHPDRFINMPNQKLAEEIFQEITENERNYEKLMSLKNRAIIELKIK